jgi:hypothetical protein
MLPAAILVLAENPYDPAKDILYRAYLLFTIIGVVIALGGNRCPLVANWTN